MYLPQAILPEKVTWRQILPVTGNLFFVNIAQAKGYNHTNEEKTLSQLHIKLFMLKVWTVAS